jgi:hypothetical protein
MFSRKGTKAPRSRWLCPKLTPQQRLFAGASPHPSLTPASGSLLAQTIFDSLGLLSAVQNGVNRNEVIRDSVINGIRESLRQHPVKFPGLHWVNSSVEGKRIDVRVKRVQKILTNATRLPFVEGISVHKVKLGMVEDPYSHETRPRICTFAVSQSVYPTSPDSASRERSSRIRPCQSGGAYPSCAFDRLFQISSMTPIFSATVISFSGRVTFIGVTSAIHMLASSGMAFRQ